MKKLSLIAAILLSTCLTTSAIAADKAKTKKVKPKPAPTLKIGVVNVREVLQRSPEAAQIAKKLEKEFATRKDQIVANQKKLQRKIDRLQRDKDILSESEVKRLQSQIMSEQRELQIMSKEFREDGAQRQREETQAVLRDISRMINKVALKGNYDLVLHRDAAPFVDAKMDITKEVLKLVEGKKKKGGKKKAKADKKPAAKKKANQKK